jgi:3-phosphoshikimate 1-carboxyvinyltransferase
MIIAGGPIAGGGVHSRDDHRIAMAFSMAALRASGSISIDDTENVNTSFPAFVDLASTSGLSIRAEG